MKALEKIIGINVNDMKGTFPALKEMKNRLYKDYFETTHPKLKMLDQLILFSIFTFVIQIGYAVLVGKDPFNSLLAGLFCALGQFALATSLRIQLCDETFANYSNKRALAEFIVGSFLLYLACLCLIG